MKKIATVLCGAVIGLLFVPAQAGAWRLDPRRCADIHEDVRDMREDRRDARFDRGRQDRREDRFDRRENRRDRLITVCPKSAFVYVPDRREARRGRIKTPKLKLHFDRTLRMHYCFDHGRKIYVRG